MKIARVPIVVTVALGLLAYAAASHAFSIGFSNRNIRGTYAGQFSGVVIEGGTPLNVVGSGIFVADGTGNISGHESYVFNGSPCTVKVSGTYQVNYDGGGSTTITLSAGPATCDDTFTENLAIADGGHTILFSNTGAGQEVTGTWRLQGSPF
jgi:hypothetical protein